MGLIREEEMDRRKEIKKDREECCRFKKLLEVGSKEGKWGRRVEKDPTSAGSARSQLPPPSVPWLHRLQQVR